VTVVRSLATVSVAAVIFIVGPHTQGPVITSMAVAAIGTDITRSRLTSSSAIPP
jgi:hypothetical protein